jgi:hypothetical protein
MKHLLIALSLTAAATGLAHAAEDGLLGATSTGTLDLHMTIRTPKLVKISGLESLSFTIEDNNDPAIPVRQTSFCVYSSLGSKFTIKVNAGNLRRRGTDLPYSFGLDELDANGQRTRSLLNGSVTDAPVSREAIDVTPATTEDCEGTFENLRLNLQLSADTIGANVTGTATTQIEFTVVAQ